MAHNITQVTGKAEVMVVGEPPWHKLGTVLKEAATSSEAIQAGGLKWKVEQRPLFTKTADGLELKIPHRKALVRTDVFDKDPKSGLLGVAGNDYHILQNQHAFSFFDEVVGSKQAIYHTCGSLDGGKKVWVLAKLPDSITVLNGDDVDKYLLLVNGHTGTSGLTIRFTPIRVVCQNTLSLALRKWDGESVFHTHHGAGLDERLRTAKFSMGIVQKAYAHLSSIYQAMAKHSMPVDQMRSYFEEVIPLPDPKKSGPMIERRRVLAQETRVGMMRLVDSGRGSDVNGVRGSLWGAYNAATEWVDHYAFSPDDTTKHLGSIWFGHGAQLKGRAFSIAEKIVTGSHN
jgi:phage/plasmid-like protein (TIGR03299 family)